MKQRIYTMLATVLIAVSGAGVAYATTRQAATDEYGGSTVIGSGTTTGGTGTTTPTITGSGTTSTTGTTTTSTGTTTGTTGTTPPGTTTGTTSTATTGTSTATTAGPASAAAGATVTSTVPDVILIDFGLAGDKLRADVAKAIALTGLTSQQANLTRSRLRAFLKSASLRALSSNGVRAAGRALGAQLVTNSTPAQRAFARLFPGTPSAPVARAVLTRRTKLSTDENRFLVGVAEGLHSTGIPLAFAERSDASKSFAKAFRKLGVLTVKDVETYTGQVRLARILLGQVSTQKAVNAVKADRASAAITPDDGSTGTAPWLLLAVLAGAGGIAASGPIRRRVLRRGAA